MAASSATSSGSPPDLDQRKRKRMQSNRESARRSRMRKQKHLDDLTAQAAELRKERAHISSSISATTQHYVRVEAENSILRAQMMELSHRLRSLNDIMTYINTASASASASTSAVGSCMFESEEFQLQLQQQQQQQQGSYINGDGFFNGSWNSMGLSHQYPIMAEMFDDY